MESWLRYGVFISFLVSFFSLLMLVLTTFSFGRKAPKAKPRGSAARGILYAFGRGMLPWEKESSRRHPLIYFSGLSYHAGILSGFFFLFSQILPFALSPLLIFVVRLFLGLGFISGLSLFLRRVFHPQLRRISCPDDFFSNLVVDAFLLAALASSFYFEWQPFFYGISILTLLVIPVGKIRHCFFFFYTRILFGAFFGRRGVLPPRKLKHYS
ncbi:MAG: hypothetical protein ACE5LC_04035 [Candidatus Aminicenantales bacterium]